MDVILRQALPEDAEQTIAHVRRLSSEPGVSIIIGPGEFDTTVAQQRQFLRDCAAADNHVYLVAEADGQIVGVLICRGGRRRAMRHTATLSMSVAQEWRNQGIGSKLLARAIEWARATGIVTRIELHVYARNEAAIHLYKKYGFEVEGRLRRRVYRDGEYHDNLAMALLL
jgi:ribosomal protein S18 acetylase RimI-like enzyme